jgi:hypothetical protein
MNNPNLKAEPKHRFKLVLIALLLLCYSTNALSFTLRTDYVSISINEKGYITSIKSNDLHREYSPFGKPSALLSLQKGSAYILPDKAMYNAAKRQITLRYPNGSVACVMAIQDKSHLKLKLLSLTQRNGIDNIVWGPYNTTISKTIGDIFCVVRDDRFAIGIMALDDNTTSGVPCDGDMAQGCYIIHSPDPVKYPIPAGLKEGQRFRIGGDGVNDVAFFSHPEEYYRFIMGNGATLEPAFGSSIAMHARDRSKAQTIFFPHYNDFPDVKAPRHMVVDPVDVDYIGSSIAFYGCPDTLGLKVIEKIVLAEGLPHITIDGKWIKDPSVFRPDIAWSGTQDSLISYAKRLGLKAIQDEGMGEYYVNPADRWANKKVTLGGEKIAISDFTKMTNAHGIGYGLHTLTEFVQPHSSHVHPIPNDSLCVVLRTKITRNINPNDTIVCVADTSYLNEKGAWDDNRTNVLKLGNELITYAGVTTSRPFTLKGVKRGAYGTSALAHQDGDAIAKLQVNCYSGFVPDMNLQDWYADFFAKWLVDGGMQYIDFDGFESCTYQGQGQYSFKRFMRALFSKYHAYGGDYLRIMGSCVFEGTWHYMSVCNIGGDKNMFDPIANKWGIEGKDVRYAFQSSYFPCTFGIQNLQTNWTVQTIDNLQAKSIAWDAMYMLGLNQFNVERCAQKEAIFKTFRAWENARSANVFPQKLKDEMKPEANMYHLEQLDGSTWKLYRVFPSGEYGAAVVLRRTEK